MKVKPIKTIEDLKERLNLSDAEIHSAVHWGNLIEQHFFNERIVSPHNYENRAIDFCIENKIDFTVTQNNPYEMLTRFVRLICPKCSGEMKVKSSGGDTHSHNIGCRCARCGTEGSLRIDVPDGMSFHFKG
jgi:Zn finger protein HypA/HybF involved in hydrogenase expression